MTNSSICLELDTTYKTPNLLVVALAWVKKANAIYRQRATLKNMSASRRQDIGISAKDAAREASRSFWDF